MGMHIFIYMYVHALIPIFVVYVCTGVDMHVHTHTTFLLSQLRRPRVSDTPVATNIPSTRILFLVPFSKKRNQDFLDKWLIIGLGNM